MSDEQPPPAKDRAVTVRLLVSVLALVCGIAALVVAIVLVRGTLA